MHMGSVTALLRRFWPALVVLAIVLLATYIRVLDYNLPYLRNIDSYAFTRQIEDIVTHGTLPTHDDLFLAPDGQDRPISRDLYIYVMAYGYGFFHVLLPGLTLFQFLVWAPALLAALMAIPMYYLGKLLYDRRAGVLAAFFVVFDISVMSRTLGADPDNDGSVLLFPLIAIALFFIAYKHVSTHGFNHKGIVYTALAGIGMGAWGFVWTGSWFVIWLLAGFLILKALFILAQKRSLAGLREMRRPVGVFAAVMLIFFLLTVPLLGVNVIPDTLRGPLSFAEIKVEDNQDFPNVYVSVAELQSGGALREILQRTNGFLFVGMLGALAYLAYSALMRRGEHLDTFILLLIWFVGPFIAASIGVRFAILFAAPIALGSAIFFAKILRVCEGEEVAA